MQSLIRPAILAGSQLSHEFDTRECGVLHAHERVFVFAGVLGVNGRAWKLFDVVGL